ncbi:MAG: pirin family protein, partial [Chitinophagaceae bacterium]
MASLRKITGVLDPPAPHMVGDGFRVHNFFPGGHKIDMSPFFLMDYNSKIEFSARENPRGVGVHPHRGFETVTLAYHGAVAHHDSAGNSGVIYPGDVQWMTAASGILHKEYHDAAYSREGGPFQMVQLWVNLPAAHKMSAPKYQSVTQEKMGIYVIPDGGGVVWCVYLCGGRFVYRYGVALQAGVSLWMMFSKVLGTILLSWGECKRLHYCTLVGLAYCLLGPCLRSPSSLVSHALWWRLVWAYGAG